MSDYEMFKTTLMGGFDKDDVLSRFQEVKDNAFKEKSRLEKELKDREDHILELTKRVELLQYQKERLEQDIAEKYQKYIDNYDNIGRLVFDARIRADKMVDDARKEHDEILARANEEASRRMNDADFEARSRIDHVQKEVNDKLAEGKQRYIAVQDELNEIVELVNQTQRRFMASYKEVHKIIAAMPASLNELEELEEKQKNQVDAMEEDAFDEDEDMSEEELKELFKGKESLELTQEF